MGLRTEVQTPVGLIAIENASRLQHAVFIHTFFYAQELPMLPLALDEGRRRLARPEDNLLRLLLLRGTGWTEIHSAIVSSNEKLIEWSSLKNEAPFFVPP